MTHNTNQQSSEARRFLKAAVYTTINWCGIELTIRHIENWGAGFDHIEITSRNRVPFPISKTGYRSYFTPGEELHPYGDAEGYVRAWLEEAAQSETWKKLDSQTRQLSLF